MMLQVARFETNGIKVGRISVDCSDVGTMVRFWSAALGYEVSEQARDAALLHHPAGAGPKLLLRQRARQRSVRWPGRRGGRRDEHGTAQDEDPNRLHLELFAADAERVVGWLATLGARKLSRYESHGETGYVLRDPEGNEFRVMNAGPTAFARPFS
ncbi:glyoxalase [Frankia sp. CcI49]|uniref:VOC family protein n=1 Tax=unclassified Frankia TaxID=2632575 RepID=UPI0006C9FEBC|nr:MULTISPECIES: VOC family protein [unclassified Frankia]KPM54640.1 glyoxalase [Frankia sp. R43]ONH61257.1 glyoxalase [Frankia sp. CcI49]